MMTVGSLFSGIGGFDLGLERAGFEIKWQVEIDPYCQRVLANHWPEVKRYEDIFDINCSTVEPVDLLCGGFPCQPVSVAGAQRGQIDERWLWPEFFRIISVLRPRFVLIENVPGLLAANDGCAFASILRDLAEGGYDAEWTSICAGAFGLPHVRQRIWILAYPAGFGWNFFSSQSKALVQIRDRIVQTPLTSGHRWERKDGGHCLDAVGWTVEPYLCGSNDGLPTRLDKDMIHALGNSIVPQIAEALGRMILEAEKQ